jgi:hypothetical protein
MQKLASPLFAIAPLLALLSACGSSGSTDTSASTASGGTGGGAGGSSGDSCVVSASVRALLEETLIEDTYTAMDVSKNSADKKYGFGIQIPGSEEGYVGYTTVISTCPTNDVVGSCYSTEMPSDPVEEFWKVHDRCVRFRCEQGGANVALVDTYLTMQPKMAATDKHEFTYDTTNPTGLATFDPNPFITWRIDFTDMAAIQVTAKVTSVVRIVETDETFIDFSHTGSIAVSRTDADVSLVNVDLEFGSLLKGGEKLTGSVLVDAAGGITGEIKAGTESIALIKDDFVISWLGDCK